MGSLEKIRLKIRKILATESRINAIKVPDTGGWYAKRSESEDRIIYIYDDNDEVNGVLVDRHHDEPVLKFHHKGKNKKIPWDFYDVKNAVRYVYLHRHKNKGITESIRGKHIVARDSVVFDDLGGLYAVGMIDNDVTLESVKGRDTHIYATIYGPNDENFGFLATGGGLYYVLPHTRGSNQRKSDVKFSVNLDGVKNAARYIYLKNATKKQSLSEEDKEVKSVSEEFGCGSVLALPETPEIRSYHKCDSQGRWSSWLIFTGKNPLTGHIIGKMDIASVSDNPDIGRLFWRKSKSSEYELAGDFKGDIRNAMRFVWLNMYPKKDARLKTGRYD
jgi:hypothetical protein